MAQALAGQVNGHTGGGTAGVDHHGGALEVEVIGQARGDDGVGGAGKGLVEVAGGFGADEHADLGVCQAFGVVAGILQALPAFLEDQALVRAHGLGFPGRDIEKEGIETGAFGEDPAPAAIGFAGCFRRGCSRGPG